VGIESVYMCVCMCVREREREGEREEGGVTLYEKRSNKFLPSLDFLTKHPFSFH
jgi:hypothetical protein